MNFFEFLKRLQRYIFNNNYITDEDDKSGSNWIDYSYSESVVEHSYYIY